jgi:hypothetical protein
MQLTDGLAEDLLRGARTRALELAQLWRAHPLVIAEIATALRALSYFGPTKDACARTWQRSLASYLEEVLGESAEAAAATLPTVEELHDAFAQLDTVHTGPQLREALSNILPWHQQEREGRGPTRPARLLLLEALPPLAEFHFDERLEVEGGIEVYVPSRWGIIAKALMVVYLLDATEDPVVGEREKAAFAEVAGRCGAATSQVYGVSLCLVDEISARRNESWFASVVEDAAAVRKEAA